MTVPDTGYHRVLAGKSRAQLLETLRRSGKALAIVDLAESSGLHDNTVREHLDILVRAGYVKASKEPRATRGRPRIVYSASVADEQPDREADSGSAALRILARVLAEEAGHLSQAGEHARVAAEDWVARHTPEPRGRTVTSEAEASRVVFELLRARGFAPQIDDSNGSVVLHACPYSDLAREQQQVVCNVHLGLVLGTLNSLRSEYGARFASIDPETPRCVVQLVKNRTEEPE